MAKNKKKIRLLTSLAGADFAYAPGEVIDWPAEEADRLIERDLAEEVGGSRKAVAEPAERATAGPDKKAKKKAKKK